MPKLVNLVPDDVVEPHLGGHIHYLRQRNHSDRHIRERRLTILRIARWLGHQVADVTRAELEEWQLTRTYLTPGGRHVEIVHLHQYMEWLQRYEHRADDPTLILVRPRGFGNKLPRPMADADIFLALSAADHPMHLWISLGAFCGLRCMEMANLSREHIMKTSSPALRITGKGDKTRIVPCPSNVLAELESHLTNRRGYLFSRMDGQPGPPSAMRVSERINDHLHSLGIPDTAHGLRHRFGTKLYEETKDAFLVARIMGHSSVDTTMGYVDILPMTAVAPIEKISKLKLITAA
jgi:integrase